MGDDPSGPDRLIIDLVQTSGPDMLRYLRDVLEDFGIGKIVTMYEAGTLFTELAKRGRTLPTPPPQAFHHTCRRLITEAVQVAVKACLAEHIFNVEPEAKVRIADHVIDCCFRHFAIAYIDLWADEGGMSA